MTQSGSTGGLWEAGRCFLAAGPAALVGPPRDSVPVAQHSSIFFFFLMACASLAVVVITNANEAKHKMKRNETDELWRPRIGPRVTERERVCSCHLSSRALSLSDANPFRSTKFASRSLWQMIFNGFYLLCSARLACCCCCWPGENTNNNRRGRR